MAYVFYDRVRETSETIGTGAVTFAGAVSGYQTFNSVLSNGDTTEVCVVDSNGNWQTFLGTWNSATQQMARTTAREGSAGAGVNVYFSGTDQVAWINFPAHKFENPHFTRLSLGSTYNEPTGSRRYTFYTFPTLSTPETVYRIGGGVNGTLSSSLVGYYATILDSDTLDFSPTTNGMIMNYIGQNMAAGWSGGRTTQQVQLDIAGAGTSNPTGGTATNAYHVAFGSFAYATASLGGTSGASSGNVFALNAGVKIAGAAGYHVNSAIAGEYDVGVAAGCEVGLKAGVTSVLWGNDAVRGFLADNAFMVSLTATLTDSPGWRTGFGLGAYEGWWPFTSSSRIMGLNRTASSIASGAPAYESGAGIDFTGITFGESSFKATGYKVDGSGNLGALIASGVALQTRGAITAKTAVVNTITVVEGGLYAGTLTLTCSAPTTSGTTATATVATQSLPYPSSIDARGTSYAVGDTFTIDGGTFSTQAVGEVTVVSSGQVFGVKITTPGNYSVVPAGALATTATSGGGSGLTITPMRSILTVTVSGAGTNYSEFLPPTITSAGSIATFRQAVFKVTTTATQAALDLNPGGKVKVTTHTPSSAADTGEAGTIAWDASYIYVCTAANTWKRVAIATW